MEVRPVGAELVHADRRTDRLKDMKKLIVAIRNYANAHQNRQYVFLLLHTTCIFVYLEAGTALLELRAAGVRLPAETRDPRPTLGPIQPSVQ